MEAAAFLLHRGGDPEIHAAQVFALLNGKESFWGSIPAQEPLHHFPFGAAVPVPLPLFRLPCKALNWARKWEIPS